MGKKINRRKIIGLAEGLYERYHNLSIILGDESSTLDSDAFVLETDHERIAGAARNTLLGLKSSSLDEITAHLEHLCGLVHSIYRSYNLSPETTPPHNQEAKPKQDGYVTLFKLITDAAEILPENERNKYLATMVEEVKADDDKGVEDYKLVPLFATEVLSRITRSGTPQQVWQAIDYLKSQRKHLKPAKHLISYDRCCPSSIQLTREVLDDYNDKHRKREIKPEDIKAQLDRDAAEHISTYGITEVRRVSGNSGCFEVVGRDDSGSSESYLVPNKSGKPFSRPIIKLMTAIRNRL
tara:strand:- start:2262 stop:3149 length:888 start_codon:yes stop_codon:yes gene_type:complete